MSFRPAPAWGEVRPVWVLKRGAGMQLADCRMKPLLQKSGHKQHQHNKSNCSLEKEIILGFYTFTYIFFSFLREDFLLSRSFYFSLLTCHLYQMEVGQHKKTLPHWRELWLSRNESVVRHFSSSLLYGWIDFCLQGSGSTCWDHFPEMKPEKEQ